MEPSLNLIAVLNLLGAAQAVLFACALVSVRRGNMLANRLLAALLVAISLALCWGVALYTRYILVVPHLAQLHVPFQFILGPLFYLYIKSLLEKEMRLTRRTLLHLVPALLCFLYLVPFYLQSGETKRAYLQAALNSYPVEWYVRTGLLLLQGAFYIIPIFIMVFARSGKEGELKRGVSRVDLFWVRAWVGIFTVVWIVSVVRYFLDYSAKSNLIVPLIFSVFIYTAVYARLRRPDGFEGETETVDADASSSVKKYERSTLTNDRAERHLRRLLEVMEAEKPYLDGELTLQKLADRLNLSAHHLSQIINERTGQNFFDFVNAYRVEEAKRRLLDPKRKHLSVLAISEEVGFRSKSAFNSVFKKHARVTPSEWRKSQGQNPEEEPALQEKIG